MMRCKRTERRACLQLYQDLMRKNKITFSPKPGETGFYRRARAALSNIGSVASATWTGAAGIWSRLRSLGEKDAAGIRSALLSFGANAASAAWSGIKGRWRRLAPKGKALTAGLLAAMLVLFVVLPLAGFRIETAYAAVVGIKPSPSPTPLPTSTPSASPTSLPEATPASATSIATPTDLATVTSVAPEPNHFAPGDQNEYVRKLQERLMDLDYLDIDETTDYYGTATEYAMQLFQRQHGLQVDGIAGPETLALIYSENAKPYAMSPGNTGTDVEALQRRLQELNYYNNEITGYYGMSTEAAIRAFQERNGLAVDGVAGATTRDLIFSPQAKEYPRSTQAPEQPQTSIQSSQVAEMLAFAKEQLGHRYILGTEGPKNFDCSGFAYFVLKHMGISTGRYNAAGFSKVSAWTKITSVSKLQPGDLVFFRSKRKAVSHMAIYIGDGKIIHASSSHGKVCIGTMAGYFTKNFVCGRRVFK